MGDLNKAPNGFFGNLENLRNEPYNKIIETIIKKLSLEKIIQSSVFEINNFPKTARKDLEVTETSIFYHSLLGLLKDKEWWLNSSVVDACEMFLSIARNYIPYFENYPQIGSKLSQKNKNEIFGLYQICTMQLSWNASREKKIRQVMNIKKGIFFR